MLFVQQGKKQSEGWLLHIPACYLGIATAARNFASCKFAKTYTPNSLPGPIRDLPNVQRTIGEIELELTEARHFLYSVARNGTKNPESRHLLAKELGGLNIRLLIMPYQLLTRRCVLSERKVYNEIIRFNDIIVMYVQDFTIHPWMMLRLHC